MRDARTDAALRYSPAPHYPPDLIGGPGLNPGRHGDDDWRPGFVVGLILWAAFLAVVAGLSWWAWQSPISPATLFLFVIALVGGTAAAEKAGIDT